MAKDPAHDRIPPAGRSGAPIITFGIVCCTLALAVVLVVAMTAFL